MKNWRVGVFLGAGLMAVLGCSDAGESVSQRDIREREVVVETSDVKAKRVAEHVIVSAALDRIGKTVKYDGSYVGLKYPMGDVPAERGVCTDVVVRALRDGRGIDLQKEIHEDMRAHFSAYPSKRIWGLKRPDRNIDHRRVPNMRRYFERMGYEVSKTLSQDSAFEPGDVVSCKIGKLDHVMIVSDRKNKSGRYLVIHNAGWGTVEEDWLGRVKLTGWYRVK